MLNCPDNCHPPRKASSNLGMVDHALLPRPTGICQMGAIERWKGRSSPPSLCSTLRPAISGPVHDVSSNNLDHVKELMTAKPLLNRCSTFASMASYWFLPHGLRFCVMPPRI